MGVSIAIAAFWVSVGLVLYTYIGYPSLLVLLSSLRRMARPGPEYQPLLTVLIAAYNEEASIYEKVTSTLSLAYPSDRLEILVVSDGSTDRTDSIVQSITDPRVRLLRVEERRGKTFAQNEGVKQSRGEIIVFSDATTRYERMAVAYLASHYADASVGAVSGRYKYWDPGASPTGLGSAAFWTYENWIKRCQSRLWTLTGCSGCIYSVRKSVYVPLPDSACSDLVEPLCIVRQGFRVVFEDRALAYEETTKSTGEEFAMRVRVAARGIRGVLSVPELFDFRKFAWVAFQLISHKVLRWLVPVFLAAIFVCTAALSHWSPAFRYALWAQALFYGWAILALVVPVHRLWKVLGVPLYFCIVNCAVVIAMVKVLRGQRFVVWNTARSQLESQ